MADEKDYFEEQPEDEGTAETGERRELRKFPPRRTKRMKRRRRLRKPADSRGRSVAEELVHHPHLFGL